MEIPISNLYFLLCYAWNRLEERDIIDVSAEDATSLLNLFARVLVSGTSHLLKRGLDRGYIPHSEDLKGIKGKIDFSESIKRQLFSHAKVHCLFDELDHNVLHNQILKTTISQLAIRKDLDKDYRAELADIDRRLRLIESIPLSANLFSRVQLHRNNAFYGFLMDVCEMIYRYYLVSEETGEGKFKDFIRDEKRMPQLFEDFVRNFYKIELEGRYTGYRVKGAETIYWDIANPENPDNKLLPVMVTDVSLTTPTGYTIIDTKYYKSALQKYLKETVRSTHLYQIFSYLKNIEGRSDYYKYCEGILLYPSAGYDLDLNYEIQGHKLSVKTINLAKDWQDIHANLLQLIGLNEFENMVLS